MHLLSRGCSETPAAPSRRPTSRSIRRSRSSSSARRSARSHLHAMREAIRCNQMQSDPTIRMTSRHLPEPACNEGGNQMQSDAIRSHHPDDLPSPSRAGRAGRWHSPPPRASRHTSRPACAPYGAHTRHTTCGGDSRRFEEIRGDSGRFGEIRGDSMRFGRRPKVNTASTKRAQSEHTAHATAHGTGEGCTCVRRVWAAA